MQLILIQKLLRHVRTPDGQSFVPSRQITHGGLFVDQVSIGIVLDHEAGRIPPVVEDLPNCQTRLCTTSAPPGEVEERKSPFCENWGVSDSPDSPIYAFQHPTRTCSSLSPAIDDRGTAYPRHGSRNCSGERGVPLNPASCRQGTWNDDPQNPCRDRCGRTLRRPSLRKNRERLHKEGRWE